MIRRKPVHDAQHESTLQPDANDRPTPPDDALHPEDPETAELERLYQQALSAMDALDAGIKVASATFDPADAAGETKQAKRSAAPSSDTIEPSPGQPWPGAVEPTADKSPSATQREGDGEIASPQASRFAETRGFLHAAEEQNATRVTPRQVIEAALFVGGMPLTTKKLVLLLRGEFEPEFVEQVVDELNLQYAAEARPYEVQFGEGGYRLVLRSEYERVRNRVFGIGPQEIKLSQEALEVLALVAYKQPISRPEIEALRTSSVGSLLRHLLRRELIAIQRAVDPPGEVEYRTTPRFLEVFGLSRIDDLPQADELSLK